MIKCRLPKSRFSLLNVYTLEHGQKLNEIKYEQTAMYEYVRNEFHNYQEFFHKYVVNLF